MDSRTAAYALLLLLGAFLGAVSQVMLKKAALRRHASRLREYLNPLVVCAYALFFGTTLLSVLAYRAVPLSMGPVLESTSYLYVAIFGVTIFHERLDRRKLAGLALILGGILVYALLG